MSSGLGSSGHERPTTPDSDPAYAGLLPTTPSPSRKRQKAPKVDSRIVPNPHLTSAPSPNTSASQQRQRARADANANDSPTKRVRSNTADPARYASTTSTDTDLKDPQGSDWHVEGPGQRVGYDDFSAIDWIFEYAKERQRKRLLSTSGLGGYVKSLADDSQIWIILIATGVAVGCIAAGIDVVSDWLGDLKVGLCTDVSAGGRFYLNRYFCCWGLDDFDKCRDWREWSTMMGVQARGASWIIDAIVYIIFSVLCAVAASVLVVTYSPYAKQSGIPEIKTVLGGYVMRRFLGPSTLAIKSLGLCLAVASGLWLGKEGPLIHVACCCAYVFTKLFHSIDGNEARKREVLSAAAASGISVAFGSPVGGVLFSLESLSYYFPDKTMWQSFVCAMVAAFILQASNPFRTGKLVLYQVTYNTGWHAFELVPFVIIGVLGGLYGGLFIKLNMRVARFRKSPRYPLHSRPVLEVAVVALATALVSYPVTFLRAQSSELASYLVAECSDLAFDPLGLCKSGIANTGVIFLLLVSAGLGFVLASLTFGLEIPAGVLLPSMAIGALYGRVVGLIVEVWQSEHSGWIVFSACEPDVPCITPGTYAIIGAASALAGTTRMTVSIVVIMFELTGALTYVLPIMVAVMIAKWVGDAVNERGIYEAWIRFNAYPLLDNRDGKPVPDVPVAQIMTRAEDLTVITATGHTVASLNALLQRTGFRGYPVVSNVTDALLLGYISRAELAFALASSGRSHDIGPGTSCIFVHQARADPADTLDLRPWMDQTPITLNSASKLQLTVNMLERLGLRYIVLADRGILAGLLTKKDLWYVLNEGDVYHEDRAVGKIGRTEREREREERSGDERHGLLAEDRTSGHVF